MSALKSDSKDFDVSYFPQDLSFIRCSDILLDKDRKIIVLQREDR